MRPQVTVGVCVRDCQEYIKEALDSIQGQDFPHKSMEVILVDDGSKDKTLSTIQDCVLRMDMPARIFHTSWKGLGHARNIVMANAKGELILWVDGDMTLSADFARKLTEFMERNPKVGIVKGRQTLNLKTNLLGTLEAFSRAAGRMVDYESEKAHSKALGTGGAIYRIVAIKQSGGFDENLRGYGEDWDIETRIRRSGWKLCTLNVSFSDYERYGLTWRKLWSRYWTRGYQTHYFLHKNPGMIKHYRMLPYAAFISGIFQSLKLFKLTRRKVVFLLPFECMMKMIAWYLGFLKSNVDKQMYAME